MSEERVCVARVWVALGLGALACAGGCTEESRAGYDVEICSTSIALYGALDGSRAEVIRPEQAAAIGALEDADGFEVCTGTLIAATAVLTGRHCSPPGGVWFRAMGATARAGIVGRYDHPERDLAILQLEAGPRIGAGVVEPIALYDAPLDASWVGREVTLAGAGDTELGTRGALHFIEESIASLDDQRITVDGEGTRGACGGDSGGPALTADFGGEAKLIGVLSRGDPSCVGKDVYERIDTARDWLDEQLGNAQNNPCGTVGPEGRCDAGAAAWCVNGQIVSNECADGTRCGWSTQDRGFRCVHPGEDPCQGVDGAGICVNNVLWRCNRGRLLAKECSPCGEVCSRGPTNVAQCR
jgi:hypothetical protein